MAGINVREADFISAAQNAMSNLVAAGVDLIVDGGDMAHVPAPKKRAIHALIEHVRSAEVPYLSADGNHTSLKSTSDIHVYDILSSECPNFVGVTGSRTVTISGLRIGLVAHSYEPEVTQQRIVEVMADDPHMLVGHWAASDIQYDSAQVPLESLPTDIPVFLGHYHKHTYQDSPLPKYIGSTEHTAWDQWDYPTGVMIYDTDAKTYEYIMHRTRDFINLNAGVENYLDVMDKESLEDAIVRLTIKATAAEYGALNLREARKKAYELGALAYHHRRAKDKNKEDPSVEAYEGRPVNEAWQDHIKSATIPSGVKRDRVQEIGMDALNG
jgi:DNA repair exonuclease SbcCD nuclease subunit